MKSTILTVDTSAALGDLIAWAEEPLHCNGNTDVAVWLQWCAARNEEAYPVTFPVPPQIAHDLEALCDDLQESNDAAQEDSFFGIGHSAEMWAVRGRNAEEDKPQLPDIGQVCPTAPTHLWLQVDPEPQDGKPVYPSNPAQDDVTWCVDKINDSDTLYVRADLVKELQQP